MTNEKVFQLAVKIANKYNDAWQEQRDRLEAFYYDTSKFFRSLVSEMNGDLSTLKHKKVHSDVVRMFADISHKLSQLYVAIDPEHPYDGIENLVNWAESKQTRSILENLQFLIREYLKNDNTRFEQSPNLKHAQIDSIRKLQGIVPKLRNFMNNHPLLPDPRNISTLPPPITVDIPRNLNTNDPTAIFNVPEKIPAE